MRRSRYCNVSGTTHDFSLNWNYLIKQWKKTKSLKTFDENDPFKAKEPEQAQNAEGKSGEDTNMEDLPDDCLSADEEAGTSDDAEGAESLKQDTLRANSHR